jgi:hypothetical protein
MPIRLYWLFIYFANDIALNFKWVTFVCVLFLRCTPFSPLSFSLCLSSRLTCFEYPYEPKRVVKFHRAMTRGLVVSINKRAVLSKQATNPIKIVHFQHWDGMFGDDKCIFVTHNWYYCGWKLNFEIKIDGNLPVTCIIQCGTIWK